MKVNFVRGTTVDRDFVHWRMAAFDPSILIVNDFDTFIWLGFSLDQFMQISWRIKSWTLSGTFSFVNGLATYTETLTNAPVVYQKIDSITQPLSSEDIFRRPRINGAPAVNEGEIMDFANPKFREWAFVSSVWQEVIPPVFTAGNILTPIGGVEGLGKALSNDALLNVGALAFDSKNSWTARNPDDAPFITRTVTGDATLYADEPGVAQPMALLFRALHIQPGITVTGVIPQNRVYFDPITKKFFMPLMLKRSGQTIFVRAGPSFSIINGIYAFSSNPSGGSINVTAGSFSIAGLGGDAISVPIYANMQPLGAATASSIVANFTLTPNELWAYS